MHASASETKASLIRKKRWTNASTSRAKQVEFDSALSQSPFADEAEFLSALLPYEERQRLLQRKQLIEREQQNAQLLLNTATQKHNTQKRMQSWRGRRWFRTFLAEGLRPNASWPR